MLYPFGSEVAPCLWSPEEVVRRVLGVCAEGLVASGLATGVRRDPRPGAALGSALVLVAQDSQWAREFARDAEVDCAAPEDEEEAAAAQRRARTYRGLGVEVPLCHHNRPARRLVVGERNEKGNAGRAYFSCDAPYFSKRCDFFVFESDLDELEPFAHLEPQPDMNTTQKLYDSICLTDEVRLAMWSGLRQGSEEWLRARQNPWASASSAGDLLQPARVHGLTLKKVWVKESSRGSRATRHGHAKEDLVVQFVRRLLEHLPPDDDEEAGEEEEEGGPARWEASVLSDFGTWVTPDGTLAVSPDGVVFAYRRRGCHLDPPACVFGLECKAPYSLRARVPTLDAVAVYKSERVTLDGARVPVPCCPTYYAQMQMLMHALGLRFMLFAAATQHGVQLSLFQYHERYAEELADVARKWCIDTVIPNIVARNVGFTAPGQLL